MKKFKYYSFQKSFSWPKNIQEAKNIQIALRDKVKIIPLRKKPEFVAGVDAAFINDMVIGVACVFKFPQLLPVEDKFIIDKLIFPYIPGFLSFREGPAIIEVLKSLKTQPDVVIFDGQGIAHPKGLGIASHIGVLLDVPSVGCAKSKLIGYYKEPGQTKGDLSLLIFKGEIKGAVLRTRDNVNPVFVSPGHRVDLNTSIKIVLECTGEFRIPEPLRRADILSKRIKNEQNKIFLNR